MLLIDLSLGLGRQPLFRYDPRIPVKWIAEAEVCQDQDCNYAVDLEYEIAEDRIMFETIMRQLYSLLSL